MSRSSIPQSTLKMTWKGWDDSPGTGSFLLPAADKEAPSKQIDVLAGVRSAVTLRGLSRARVSCELRGMLQPPKGCPRVRRVLLPVNHSWGREGLLLSRCAGIKLH